MMSDNNNAFPFRGMKFSAIGLATGLVFGGLVGFAIGQPIIFTGGTMVLGFAIGAALDKKRSSEDS